MVLLFGMVLCLMFLSKKKWNKLRISIVNLKINIMKQKILYLLFFMILKSCYGLLVVLVGYLKNSIKINWIKMLMNICSLFLMEVYG